MNKRIGLMALTGVLTLASCGQGDTVTNCATGQSLVNGVCVVSTGTLTINNPSNYAVVVKDSAGNVVDAAKYATLTPGNYIVTFSKDGYVSQTVPAAVTAGGNTVVTAPMLMQPGATTGAVSITNPNGYTVVIKDANGNVIPSTQYGSLAPGNYSIAFSADGYTTQTSPFSITAGQTTTVIAPTLSAVGTTTSKTAYYVGANNAIVPITSTNPADFRFEAWMQDVTGAGINPAQVGMGYAGTTDDAMLGENNEKHEVAPLNHQNILAAYMTYTPDGGKTFYPVIGADVRWDITEQEGGVRFSAADDGANDSGAIRPLDINANATSALTWTNRAGYQNVQYPASAKYPTYNLTGVNTPDKTGYTWTALNHDPSYDYAAARVRVIGYVNGQEIEKHWLTKEYAPSAHLTINKATDQEATVGQARTFTITVKNDGEGPATGIQLNDVLKTGNGTLYSVTNIAADGTVTTGPTANTTDGFDATFDLAAGETRVFTFQASATDAGQFCDVASISTYINGPFGTVTPGVTPSQEALSDQACLTVRAPKLTVVKTLVDAIGNPLADQTLAAGQNAQVRITLTNGGDLAAEGVVLTDALTQGDAAAYQIGAVAPATGVTLNGNDGFTTAAQTINPGQSVSYTFPAQATADGRYCDVASFTSTNAGTGQDDACFTVATARLAITKTNTPATNLYPGGSYTSTITLTNTGTAAAQGVNLQDVIGNNATYGYLTYGSGTYTVTGTTQQGSVSFANNTATTVPANAVTIPAGGQLVLTITTSVPSTARAGQYCDVASFTSTNSQPASGQQQACVTVNAFIGEQTQLTDTVDPLRVGAQSLLSAAASVEPTSNQGATNNVFYFNMGTKDPANFQNGGVFNFTGAEFYYDPTPTRDPQTGAISSDYNNASSTRITPTLSAATGTGVFTATLDPNFVVAPGAVVWIRVPFSAPAGTAPGQYQDVFRWTNTGQDDGAPYINQKAESTTIIP